MRSDAVLGMARISLLIYSDVVGLCMAVSGKVRQCCAVSGIARKGKDSLINFLLGNPQFGHAMWCLVLPCAAMR